MSGEYSRTELARKAPGYGLKVARRWLARQYRRLYFRRRPDHPALDREAATRRLRSADSVLFLCWGNICRSPLAERYLRALLDERGVDDVTVRSAGLGEAEGRPSPSTAVAAAGDRGVDLDDHVSQCATAALLDQCDVAFVMDLNNYHSVATSFPDAAEKTFFLGAFATDADDPTHREALVPDPNGSDRETFDEVYDAVAAAVEEIAAVLAERERAPAEGV